MIWWKQPYNGLYVPRPILPADRFNHDDSPEDVTEALARIHTTLDNTLWSQEGDRGLTEGIFAIARALDRNLTSPNEWDRNGEAANVVDGLFYMGRGIHRLAAVIEKIAGVATPKGPEAPAFRGIPVKDLEATTTNGQHDREAPW